MKFLVRFLVACADFLFPKSKKVLELEQLSSGEILKILPPAEEVEDRNILALFDYRDPLVREIIWSIKYRGDRILAGKMSEILSDVLAHEFADRFLFEKFERPLLVPMPISGKRRFERGWNQTELLGEAIKKRMNGSLKYLPNQLIKFRHTESQTQTSSKTERQRNLKGSMRVLNPDTVKDRCVVLLDDVTTTGSSFAEGKRALKEAGAKKVLCIAIAH